MGYFLYIVRCRDRTLYTGITTDPARRVKEHNSTARGAKYTATRRPVSLVYMTEYTDRSSALIAEAALKKLSRQKKQAIITSADQDYPV